MNDIILSVQKVDINIYLRSEFYELKIVFKPLFGEYDVLNSFFDTADQHYQVEEYSAFSYEQDSDAIEMAREITEVYPGITFIGYRIENDTYRQMLFNAQDGIFFMGKKSYTADDQTHVMIGDMCIRGLKLNNLEEGQEPIHNDDLNGGYSAE